LTEPQKARSGRTNGPPVSVRRSTSCCCAEIVSTGQWVTSNAQAPA